MRLAVLAHYEPDSRFETQWVKSRRAKIGRQLPARWPQSRGSACRCRRYLAHFGAYSGEPGDAKGISLFRVPRDAKGLSLDQYSTIDGQRAADIYSWRASPGEQQLGVEGGALPGIDAALDVGLAALCAEAVGVMQALVDATVAYVQSRQQFGTAIGRFQSLAASHRGYADSIWSRPAP